MIYILRFFWIIIGVNFFTMEDSDNGNGHAFQVGSWKFEVILKAFFWQIKTRSKISYEVHDINIMLAVFHYTFIFDLWK